MINISDANSLPENTGVYIFYKQDKPLYVGKAINIRVRVKSHIKNSENFPKEYAIISRSDSIQTIPTNSEFNALVLEANLIKKLKPQYNSIWKDDKQYVYIKVNKSNIFPSVTLVRKENQKNSLYFGPFSSKRIVLQLLRDIRKIIPFSTHEKLPERTCFYHKIGLCSPCPAELSSENKARLTKIYRKNLKLIINLLKGRVNELEKYYEIQMKKNSENNNFEEAALWRNKLFLLRKLVYTARFRESIEGTENIIKNTNLSAGLLKKYYPHLSNLNRIECFDASSFSGEESVGSMVVFINGYPAPAEYRKFKIKDTFSRSDFDYLQEIIKRRLKHTEWLYPDLIVIDGGKPQLKAVRKTFDLNGILIPIIGIAKGIDRIIIGFPPFKTVIISDNDPLFTMLRYIRDESHRFAKKYHVLLRERIVKSM